MIKPRNLQRLLQKRIAEPDGLIQIVVGPRQVGKTTAIRGALEGRGIYVSADSPTPLPVRLISSWWNEALEKEFSILAIDEVQKIPGWSEEIKRLWDFSTNRPKVLLSGSSSLLIERGLSESLAGRFEIIRAEHWSLAEALDHFGRGVNSFINFGCYPGAEFLLSDLDRWSAYIRDAIVEPALGRDVLQLHPIENPALLREIFAVAVSLPAQIISLQKIQGQLQVKGAVATISNYLHLLSQGFLVSGVQKYSPQPFRARQSSPKLIVHDNALIRAFERPVNDDLPGEKFGRYFENAVGARFIEAGWSTYYWKERSYEVDYVVDGPHGEHWAVEVKCGEPTRDELKGMFRFCQKYPAYSPHLVTLSNCSLYDVVVHRAEEILSLSRALEK